MHEEDEDFSTTLALIRQHQNGDEAAFSLLYERHAPAVRKSVACRLGTRLSQLVEVEDLIQETFLSAWGVIESGAFTGPRPVGGFRHMLVKIALHKVQDHAKWHNRVRRDAKRTVSIDDVPEKLIDDGPRPSQHARAHELEALGEQALLRLGERDRFVIDCRDNLGLSYDDIATELQCKAANAKLRFFRAEHDKRLSSPGVSDCHVRLGPRRAPAAHRWC